MMLCGFADGGGDDDDGKWNWMKREWNVSYFIGILLKWEKISNKCLDFVTITMHQINVKTMKAFIYFYSIVAVISCYAVVHLLTSPVFSPHLLTLYFPLQKVSYLLSAFALSYIFIVYSVTLTTLTSIPDRVSSWVRGQKSNGFSVHWKGWD